MQTQQQTVDRPYVDPSQNIVGAILIKMDSLAESDPEEAFVLSGGLMGTELGFDYIWKTTAPLCRALCFEVRSRAFAALKDWAKAKEAARAGLAIVDEATEQGIPSEDSCAWEHIEETMRDVIKEANAAITADAEDANASPSALDVERQTAAEPALLNPFQHGMPAAGR